MDEQVNNKFNLFRNQVEKFVAFTDEEWLIFQLVFLKKKDFFVRERCLSNWRHLFLKQNHPILPLIN